MGPCGSLDESSLGQSLGMMRAGASKMEWCWERGKPRVKKSFDILGMPIDCCSIVHLRCGFFGGMAIPSLSHILCCMYIYITCIYYTCGVCYNVMPGSFVDVFYYACSWT